MGRVEQNDDSLDFVTEDSLDLTPIAGRPRELKLPVDREIRVFPVRRHLSIDQTISFLELEQTINDALRSEDDDALLPALKQANAAIRAVIEELTPNVPVLNLDENQILVTLSWLAGDVSVATKVAKVLTAGQSAATEADAVATTHDGSEDDAHEHGGDDAAPLALAQASPSS